MKKRLSILVSVLVPVVAALGISSNQIVSATVPGTNTLVSVNNSGNGQGGNDDSYINSMPNTTRISANGKYVAFISSATDLVSGDTNGYPDVFVRDLANNTTTRVNVSSSGVQSDNTVVITLSSSLAISRTGRYVVFTSKATNLIDGQTIPSTTPQVYIHDMQTGTTDVVTRNSSGTVGNGSGVSVHDVSSDGRFVAIATNSTNLGVATSSYNVIMRADRQNQTFDAVNIPPAGGSTNFGNVSMDCSGTLIAYATTSKMTADDTDSSYDVYLADLRNGLSTTNITTLTTGTKSGIYAKVSCNGDFVAFGSNDYQFAPSLVSPTDNNTHMYVYNRVTDTYSLADQSSAGVVGNNQVTETGAVDDNGDVIFNSNATNLQSGYSGAHAGQIWLHNYTTGTTEILTKSSSGSAGSLGSGNTDISATGKVATYYSAATNLIGSDTNAKIDVFTSLTGL